MKLKIIPDQKAAADRGIMIILRKSAAPASILSDPTVCESRCEACGAICIERKGNPPLLRRVCSVCMAPVLAAGPTTDFNITESSAAYLALHFAKPQGNA